MSADGGNQQLAARVIEALDGSIQKLNVVSDEKFSHDDIKRAKSKLSTLEDGSIAHKARLCILLWSLGKDDCIETLCGLENVTDKVPPDKMTLEDVLIPGPELQLLRSQFMLLLPRFYKDFHPRRIVSFEEGEPVTLAQKRRLGEGGQGDVFKVQQRLWPYATLARKLFHKGQQDFQTEWANLQHIGEHRHVVPVAGAYSEINGKNKNFFMFEWADNNLCDHLSALESPPTAGQQEVLHSARITRSGEVSKSMGPKLGVITRKYSAPEVLGGLDRDSRADVFSLGCVFLEIIAALAGENPKEILGEGQRYGDHPAAVQEWLAKVKKRLRNDDVGRLVEWSSKMVTKDQVRRPDINTLVDDIRMECLRRNKLSKFFCQDCCKEYTQSMLLRAVEKGNVLKTQLLLDAGASANPTGEIPLHQAAANGQISVALQLLQHGADVNSMDGKGWSALHRATVNGHGDMALILLRAEADVDAKDGEGRTALHWAADKGHTEVARELLEAGASVDAEDTSGRTALHRAAAEGHKEVVQLLLQNEANIGVVDFTEKTALKWATEKTHKEVQQLLRQRGAGGEEPDTNATHPPGDGEENANPGGGAYEANIAQTEGSWNVSLLQHV